MLENYRKKIGIQFLKAGIHMAPEYFIAKVDDRAKLVAAQALREEMQRQGLLICSAPLCGNRYGLMRINGALLCPKHCGILTKV